MMPGDSVRLRTPDNVRLDGAAATVERLADWGAFVLTPAAATGQFRAAWHEIEEGLALGNGHSAREEGYTGDLCDMCGGVRMKRAGNCLCCEDCGSSSGCG